MLSYPMILCWGPYIMFISGETDLGYEVWPKKLIEFHMGH